MTEMLRAPAEVKYADELDWLESVDDGPKPFSWRLSPKMVRLFILGSQRADGLDREIPQKWFGDRSFVERAVVTLTHTETVNAHARIYLNRLSDFLFVLGRVANNNGTGDVLWVPGASREG